MWNNLWSVSRYVMGPLSGRWRQSGNDQQCLAAPIWRYRSGFGDHRFTFFIDLRPNYTFYTNLSNIVHWVVAYRDVAHLVRLNLGKSWEKSAKSFDAGLRQHQIPNFKCFLFHLAFVFVQSVEARYYGDNEDIVEVPMGDAPTTSEWSTILLPSRVRLMLEVLWYISYIWYVTCAVNSMPIDWRFLLISQNNFNDICSRCVECIHSNVCQTFQCVGPFINTKTLSIFPGTSRGIPTAKIRPNAWSL